MSTVGSFLLPLPTLLICLHRRLPSTSLRPYSALSSQPTGRMRVHACHDPTSIYPYYTHGRDGHGRRCGQVKWHAIVLASLPLANPAKSPLGIRRRHRALHNAMARSSARACIFGDCCRASSLAYCHVGRFHGPLRNHPSSSWREREAILSKAGT